MNVFANYNKRHDVPCSKMFWHVGGSNGDTNSWLGSRARGCPTVAKELKSSLFVPEWKFFMEELFSSACAEIKSFLFWLCLLLCLSPTVLNPRTLLKSSVFGVNVFQISALLFFSFFPSHPQNCIFVYNYYPCFLSSSFVKSLTHILSPFMENILSTVKSSQCFSSNSPFQLENNGIKTSHGTIPQGTTHYF